MKLNASAILIAASLMNSAWANGFPAPGPQQFPGSPTAGVQQASHFAGPAPVPAVTPYAGGQYPQTNAPLYPSPVQYTPPWNGGTIITNQAFAPHEMLYPHTYRAMYPPFYYKVHGGWIWTPFGIRQHERWKLQGTEVTVKYRSHYPLFGGFIPPRIDSKGPARGNLPAF